MTCSNCGAKIAPAPNGPKPWISVTPSGSYGSFVCAVGKRLFPEGHQPAGNNA